MISIKLTVDDVDLDLLGEMTWLSAFLATKLLFFLLFVHYPLEALKILFFFFGCVGSSLLRAGFL